MYEPYSLELNVIHDTRNIAAIIKGGICRYHQAQIRPSSVIMYSIRAAISIFLVAVTPVVTAQSSDTNDPTATIDSGHLRGVATKHADSGVTVNQFLGIPFAEPPVKDLRFKPPTEKAAWDDPLDVREQPNACMQWLGPQGPATDLRVTLYADPPPPGESEDCLFINVYVPDGGEDKKPVLFWIHGGSGIAGAASSPECDGTNIAANHDIIVVATNYRLSGKLTLNASNLY